MYRYTDADRHIVAERVAQFRDQTRRYLAGELTEDQFRPLRLQNGLYLQRHAPMLRIGIHYGLVSANQMRKLAHITRTYDRGIGHLTTRQNMQLNWVKLEAVPDILAELASVDMHAIQTSGNCIRVVTSDPLAGLAPNEVADPRPWAELLRQWSTLHPEFATLPRKFKVAFSATQEDAANVQVHDLGFQLARDANNTLGFRVWVGGGLGRTPFIGKCLREFLPAPELLSYTEAVLRTYNRFGRRDNLYKSRIKILVHALGIEAFAKEVEDEWAHLSNSPLTLTADEIERVAADFIRAPDTPPSAEGRSRLKDALKIHPAFALWVNANVQAQRQPGYRAVTLSLKSSSHAPGDITADQMDTCAELAERFGRGELRTAQTQNLVLPDVREEDLFPLWKEARAAGLATASVGLLTDVISCPGGDYCSLANARSLPVAKAIQMRFIDPENLADIGPLRLNISGCVNACSHHHLGAIGVLGVDKAGEERFQVTLGGSTGEHAALGSVIGPSFAAPEIPTIVERLVRHYRQVRQPKEPFLETLQRVGKPDFIAAAYDRPSPSPAASSPETDHE